MIHSYRLVCWKRPQRQRQADAPWHVWFRFRTVSVAACLWLQDSHAKSTWWIWENHWRCVQRHQQMYVYSISFIVSSVSLSYTASVFVATCSHDCSYVVWGGWSHPVWTERHVWSWQKLKVCKSLTPSLSNSDLNFPLNVNVIWPAYTLHSPYV